MDRREAVNTGLNTGLFPEDLDLLCLGEESREAALDVLDEELKQKINRKNMGSSNLKHLSEWNSN